VHGIAIVGGATGRAGCILGSAGGRLDFMKPLV